MKKALLYLSRLVTDFILLPFVLLFIIVLRMMLKRSDSPRLVWGPEPLINNQYWSDALKRNGYVTRTFMYGHSSSIHHRDLYDLYPEDLLGSKLKIIPAKLLILLKPYIGFCYAVIHFDIFHHHYFGGFLKDIALWRIEALLLKLAGKRVLVSPYGGDAYMYSKITDLALRHALLLSYPEMAKLEGKIAKRVEYWTKYADAIAGSSMTDGLGRWDTMQFNMLSIDTSLWRAKGNYHVNDGVTGVVKVLHAPNHRGFKGTEFIIQAIDDLKQEGLKVELILLEGKQNEEVKRIMREDADILAEQLICTGHGLNAIEGMASALPVLSNLDGERYTRVFRRYSYLDECPILSTTPETIKENIRVLVKNPDLREELGRAGREYVEKYHSDEMAVYLFGSIYRKIWHGEDVDLLNLFHPLKSEFNLSKPKIHHPLIENKLPEGYVRS